jgi:hypothetical protein
MAFIQLIPQSTVSEGVPTILLPLGLVLLATIFREGYEDRKRHESDRIENARKVLRLCDGQWRACTWADLCVSDLIRIKSNETFPTDTLILNANTSLHEDGRAYVQTTSLDGETNLKMKRACLPVALKSFIDEGNARDAAKELERYVVKCLAPNADVSNLLPSPSPPPLTSSLTIRISQVHSFDGTLCMPVSDKSTDESIQYDAFSNQSDSASSSPSKRATPAEKEAGETLTQLGILNFAQRGNSPHHARAVCLNCKLLLL